MLNQTEQSAPITTIAEMFEWLAFNYSAEECPRCHKNRYGLAQDKYCPDCAYIGDGRNPELDRIRIGN